MKTLKRTLCLVLALALSFSVVAGAANYDTYADADAVAASKYAEAVDVVVGLGIVKGGEGNKIAPDGVFTRAMAAKILCYLMLGEDVSESLAASTTPFEDVAAADWESKYVGYAADKGILVGSEGKFNPDGELTGYALGKLILNAMGYGIDTVVEVVNGKATEVTYNYFEGPYWASRVSIEGNKIKLFEGLEGVDLDKTITRAQAMEMIFTALEIDAADAADGQDLDGDDYTVPAYAITKVAGGVVDAYNRASHKWTDNNNSGAEVSGVYSDAADYVFVANGSVTDVAEAYAKENNIDKSKVSCSTTAAAGFVYEYDVTKAADGTVTLSLITSYRYVLHEVKEIADTADADGKYAVTFESAYAPTTVKTADIGVAVAEGDYIYVPFATNYVWADAVKATPVVGKISSYAANSYVVVNGVKYYKAANEGAANLATGEGKTFAAITSGDAIFTTTYNFFVTPAGAIVASTVNVPADTNAYQYAYANKYQIKKAGSASSDLFETTAATDAAAKLSVVTLDGTAKVLDLGVTKTEEGKWYLAETAITADEITADVTNGSINAIVKYYVDANGKANVVAKYDLADATDGAYTAGAIEIADIDAKSTTVLNLIRVDAEGAYTAATYTGYKNFPAISDAGYEKYVDTTNDIIYIVADAETAPTTTDVEQIAYVKAIGDVTVNGTAFTFVINGKEVVYYNTNASAVDVGDAYTKLTVNEKGQFTVASGDKITLAVDGVEVTALDAGYVVASGNHEYASNNQIVDLTDKGATAIVVGDKIDLIKVEEDSKVVATIFYIVAHAE